MPVFGIGATIIGEDTAISFPVFGIGATIIGDEAAISFPVLGIGATIIGDDAAISFPVFGIGATIIGELAAATAALKTRTEARTADLTFNVIELIEVLLLKRNFVPKWYPKSCTFYTTKVTFLPN